MTKEERQAWYDAIRTLQNHPANVNQDHMTICGFFKTEAEFVRHSDNLADRARRYDER